MTDFKARKVSYEFIRQLHQNVDKFTAMSRMLGHLYAEQTVREIGRLHTHYPGYRTELDYTKYGAWLFPTEKWSEPIFYYTGFGADHHSTVIKGYTVTVDPAARDAVRLYRNCVLPNTLWLPSHLRHYAHHWDVFGCEVIVAIDNATDLTANAVVLMFAINGVILLRMPPRRGDLKGTIERIQYSLETMCISGLPGYVPQKYAGLDPRFKRARDKAKAKAKMTVAEYETKLVESILSFNHEKHARFKKPRIQVWRDGQEMAPIILPTGRLQIRTTFALTYEVKLMREGVEVESLHFNSPELHSIYREYSGKAHVKLDPDDIRAVLVFVPNLDEPIEAFLTTFDIDFPMSLETLKIVLKKLEAKYGDSQVWRENIGFAILDEYRALRSGPPTRTPGKTLRSDAQAATHAAASPIDQTPPQPSSQVPNLSSLLSGSELDDNA